MRREIVVRATKIDSRSGRVKTHAPGRTCICGTRLSIYNRTERCFIHESPHFVRYRARAKQGA